MAPSANSPSAEEIGPNTTKFTILALRKTLTSETVPLARRFRALFSLKHLASSSESGNTSPEEALAAVEAIAAAFSSPSALLKHELAYCLGQTKCQAAVPFLRAVLQDKLEDSMCRHEAAEALGALADRSCLDLLKGMRDDRNEVEVVRETCDLAVDRIEWETAEENKNEKLTKRFVDFSEELNVLAKGNSNFSSIDPAPPLAQTRDAPSISDLQAILLDTNLPLFQRYRAMFALRDLSSPPNLPTAIPAVKALATGLKDPSALFRHEIAFVFGQLSHPASIPSLVETLSNLKEVSMVRHEAAEALGSLGDEEGVETTLKEFLNDREQVVRESVIVALDMAAFEKSGEVEYALVPGQESTLPVVATA